MLALEELPNKDKDALLPLFRLRPWATSTYLANSIDRLKKAFGTRQCFLELAEEEPVLPDKRRPVHSELHELRSPVAGYQNWFNFFRQEKHLQFIPTLQLGGEAADFYLQVEQLYSLGRGLLIRLEAPRAEAVSAVCAAIAPRTGNGSRVTIVLDYGKQDNNFLLAEGTIAALVGLARKNCENASIAISASSFPGSFTSIDSQKIFERVLFDRLLHADQGLIYSDRGSARAEKQLGGGGLPAPRIDYPKKDEWFFFRQSPPLVTAFHGYQAQALRLMRSDLWVKDLKLWGVQMIEKTAAGDSLGGVSSPNRSTAVRINLHLHRQLYYADEASFFDTDEEWSD